MSAEEAVEFVEGWDMVRTLGEGAYGEVKLLINRRSQQAIALKILQIEESPNPRIAKEQVAKEVRLLSTCY